MALSNNYTTNEIMSMQEDAIRRVNEMQRRSREKIMQSQNQFSHNQMNKPTFNDNINNNQNNINKNNLNNNNVHMPHRPNMDNNNLDSDTVREERCEDNQQGGFLKSLFDTGQNALTGIFDKLNLDSEIIVILMMMLLLANEGADMLLLLALVYIML